MTVHTKSQTEVFAATEDDRQMRAETPNEIEMLLRFRALTEPQQKAFMELLKAFVAFQVSLREGVR